MPDSEKILEFDKIKEKLKELAFTDKAKEEAAKLKPYLSESELRARMRDTTEARLLLEKAGQPPLTSMEGLEEILQMAEIGSCLTAEQLEKAAFFMTAVKRMKEYLRRCRQYDLGLPYFEENLDPQDALRETIVRSVRSGRVDDYASRLLRSLRGDIERTELKMREKADAVLRSNKNYLSDSFSTFRNGHICLPVKREYKLKVNGSVIDQSSTGSTVFIEPTAAGKLYEELTYLKLDEENEVRRILYTLTGQLADAAPVLRENQRMMEKLDFIFAKGKLSMEYQGTEPEINLERRIVLTDARHPLMDIGKHVPLQFQIGCGVDGIIITGPNTGGKTVAIKTVALNAMMAQCGLHVACRKADFCMNDAYLCDIGDGQNISENLSTFSAHITNVLEILKCAGRDSLVIMDELGSGTDPTEGMGIAVAVLEELKKSGALYLVTTHYPEVKQYAEKQEGMVNARMTFDKESLKPLYQLVIGEAGESCALYIAQKLGMPERMLKMAAESAYGGGIPKDLIPGMNTAAFSAGNTGEDFTEEKGRPKDTGRKGTGGGRLQKTKKIKRTDSRISQFGRGDSVMVLPDKKTGIVCEPANEKGVLRVQLKDKKIWINYKRLRLLVAAEALYPEDYDFSIVFDTVEQRKARHQMERKYVEGVTLEYEE